MFVKRRFDQYPLDMVLLGAAVVVAGLSIALDLGFVRLLVGAPLVMFLPGYALIFLLFPERRLSDTQAAQGLQDEAGAATMEEDLDRLDYQMRRQRGVLTGLERAAASIGLSICLIGLVGIALDILGIGVFLVPFLSSLLLLSLTLGAFGVARWYRVPQERRWSIELRTSPDALGKNLPARVLSIVLIVATTAAAATIFDALVDPDPPGRTRVYLLGEMGDMRCYPTVWEDGHYRASLSSSERECPPRVGNITVGLINLERQTTEYWVRLVWSQGYDALNGTPPTTVTLIDNWTTTVEPHPKANRFTQYQPGHEQVVVVPPPPSDGAWRFDVQVFKQPPGPIEATSSYLNSSDVRAHLTIERQ